MAKSPKTAAAPAAAAAASAAPAAAPVAAPTTDVQQAGDQAGQADANTSAVAGQPSVTDASDVGAAAATNDAGAADQADQADQAGQVDQVVDYEVGTVPIRHNGRLYGVGKPIPLTHAQAAKLSGLVYQPRARSH